ncbi:MAG: DUF1801 domain-containing protein [Flavobacteriales bacterium]
MNPAEHYILNQTEPFKSILLQLQVIIENSLPEVELLYKYKIPFYYIHKKPFCYLNVSKGYVDLVFWHGAHLQKNQKLLVTGGRKHMKSFRYYKTNDIHHKALTETLKEAFLIKHKKYYK